MLGRTVSAPGRNCNDHNGYRVSRGGVGRVGGARRQCWGALISAVVKACHQRCGFFVHTIENTRKSGRTVPKEELLFVVESEYANYVALQKHIMGSMKSLQHDRHMPFDVEGFIRSAQESRDS